jgi:hypothetical protein
MNFFKKVQYILIYVCGFVLIGVTSLISGDVGWRGLNDWKFYVDTGLTYAAIICIIIATLLKIIDDFKAKDAEYIAADKDIKDFATKTYRPSLFSKFCDHTNKKRKLKQYVHDIKRKIYLLETKASEEDLHIWVNGTKEARDKNEYCQKRLNLEKQLTDDYIKKNIDTTRVKYDKISSTIALGGYYSKEDNKYANEFITKNKSGKMAREQAPHLLFGFAMTCFSSSLLVSFAFDSSSIIPILTKCVTLLFQAYTTIRYANDWNQTVTLKDIRFRKGVITEYNNWIKQEYVRQQTEKQENKKDPKSIVNSLEDPLVLPEGTEREAQQLVEEINKQNTELKEV